MSCTKHWQSVLVDAANDTLGAQQQNDLSEHIKACHTCKLELAALRETLAVVEHAIPPRPAHGSLNAWSDVSRKIAQAKTTHPSSTRFSFGLPGALIGAAAMLVIGVGIGMRLVTSPPGDPVAEVTGDDVSPIPLTAQQQYTRFLERATPLLLAVANRAGDRPVTESVSFDSNAEQSLAARLADDANALGDQLHRSGLGREARLIGDLEIVFMQIANLTSADYPDSMHLVRATLEQRAILFQLTVEEMRNSGKPTTPLG